MGVYSSSIEANQTKEAREGFGFLFLKGHQPVTVISCQHPSSFADLCALDPEQCTCRGTFQFNEATKTLRDDW
jgi:hypothetical protein